MYSSYHRVGLGSPALSRRGALELYADRVFALDNVRVASQSDYFSHYLTMAKRVARPPLVFHVNWFRKQKGAGGRAACSRSPLPLAHGARRQVHVARLR